MATFRDSWIGFPHLPGLLEALKAEFEQRFIPVPCRMDVLPGDLVAFDFTNEDCGALSWARIVAVYPSRDFPAPDNTPGDYLTLAFSVELGTIRTAPIPDNAEPATYEEQFDTTRLQMADMEAMLQVLCAYADTHDLTVLIGTYSPTGPGGGAVGGTWSATFGAS